MRYQSTLIEIRSIAEEIKSRGDQHTSEVLLLERTEDPLILEALQLPAGSVAFHSRIVHFENKVPINSRTGMSMDSCFQNISSKTSRPSRPTST